jgi:hypothetical protein
MSYLVELHVGDLGGPAMCSEAQLSLCRRISTTEVELERLEARMSEGDDSVDLDVYNRLAGNLRRMLESIGLRRVARPTDGPLSLRDASQAARNERRTCTSTERRQAGKSHRQTVEGSGLRR